MSSRDKQAIKIKEDLKAEVRAIQAFSTSVIFSAVAVASSTILLFIPNLETLSLFFFLVGYRYGKTIGTTTVLTSVTIFEMFASQVYGTGGIFPFLLKFPPFLLIMATGVYFHFLKEKREKSLNNHSGYSPVISALETTSLNMPILYEPQNINQNDKETHFSFYERLLFAQLGFALTIIYDVVTSLGVIVFVPTWEGFFVSFIMGIPFYIFHQISNLILFSTIPSIVIALDKARTIS